MSASKVATTGKVEMSATDNIKEELLPVIAVTLAAHNRKETTLRCLSSLYDQKGVGQNWRLKVYLTDDGSSDNTAEETSHSFPEVHLSFGNGALYWGGGMAVAMSHALADDPDFTLMLNDDVVLQPDAIQNALFDYASAVCTTKNRSNVIVGSVTDPATGKTSYSGLERINRVDPSKLILIEPKYGKLVPCDTMCGNFVLLPRFITKQLGTVDPTFVHQLGDIDYGYRVRRAGGRNWIARQSVGTCASNGRIMPFQKPGLGWVEKWRAINHPMGLPVRSWLIFMWRWGGFLGVAKLIAIYAKHYLKAARRTSK